MKDWTPSALLHASGMYWESCAIHAAVHLDVFTPLSGGPMTVTELADRTGCVPQSLDRLLTALCAMGLLIRQGETCELPPFSRDHLCRGNPGYLGHIVEHHRHLMPGWSKLDESVRENRPTRHRSSVDTEDTGERESFSWGCTTSPTHRRNAAFRTSTFPAVPTCLISAARPGPMPSTSAVATPA